MLNKAAWIATLLDSITVKPGETKCPHELFFGSVPKWARYLRTFGEVGIVKSAASIQSKLDNKGRPCVFVGYPQHNHTGNVYRFFTIDKHSIIHSRDVQWMNQLWRQYARTQAATAANESDAESYSNPYSVLYDSEDDRADHNDSDDRRTSVSNPTGNPRNPTTPNTRVTRSGRATAPATPTSRLSREIRGLHTYYNPILDRTNIVDDDDDDQVQIEDDTEPEGQGVEEQASLFPEFAFVSVLSGAMDPTRFDDAYFAPDPAEREGWRGGISKEFADMKKRDVWERIKKKDLPPGVHLLGSKWVFKKKKSGVYRARLVAKGYDQIPGVDFTENFAPVVSDVTIRTIMMLLLYNPDWIAYIVDVETAFLYGEMDVDLYMEIPEGLQYFEDVNPNTDCLKLKRTIYGTVQAARQWFKYFIRELQTKVGFERSRTDPCLLTKQTNEGVVILCNNLR